MAPWTEAATNWPVSGLSSSQKNGVDTVNTTAATMTVIFLRRDTPTRPLPAADERAPSAAWMNFNC
ncbi:hypothetical protein OG369_40120 [Streptomyces sp. NBC_01221]|uniref:hypothetical protein n=1 Tax=Streptomyces sp. NBC_01221 TaxID=2903782 RepID=UPI00225101B5|nr:hypothetical protein [Streptomyces sp. NBC_01221]MCX4792056.1 hypothetical protein [Streptomyces sp. NBC_01221]